ncbi:DUF6502 family protein [Noviherbaspirillum massiliense]|uniref:DUF6502 family protein n=1 Tax=Noviherbaspirillum massiliense TaxID=1465823 RepID=UPI00036D0A95|nr:DUF6502 family protein [Noviherbaspirillum massiliense]
MDNKARQGDDESGIDAVHSTPGGVAVLQQAALAFRPLVRLLLSHGVTYPQLTEMLKGVFIEVAREEVRDNGRRMTDSRLAVKTGIHRKDAKRLSGARARATPDGPRKMSVSLPSAVFTRWLSDPAFCEKDGKPRTLLRRGDAPHDFASLVKCISTDVHPRTVLNELSRLGLVDVDGESVHPRLNAFVPNSDFAQMLAYLGANLHDHAATAVRNTLGIKPAFLEQSIYSDAVHANAVAELAGLARQEWTHILKSFVPEVARHEPDTQDAQPAAGANPPRYARIRLGMYFYAEDEREPAQDLQNDLDRKAK